MKRIFSFLLCLMLIFSAALPVRAQEQIVLRSKVDRYNGIYATYTYNEKGWLLRETLSWGDVTEYEHYSTGVPRRAVTKDPEGKVLKVQSFDSKGTVLFIDEPDGKGGISRAWNYTNRYDDQGRLTEQERRSVPEYMGERERFTYFEDGGYSREFTLYYIYEGVSTDHIHYIETFDATGHMTKRYQDLEYGYEVEYTYEETYDGDGFLTASRNRAYAPGSYDTRSTTTYTYDDLGGLLAEATFTQGEKGRLCTTTVYTYKNGYDDQGRLIQALRSCHLTTVDMAGNASSSLSTDSWLTVCEYDSKGRTVSMMEGSREGEWMNIWTWAYDEWDNLQNYSLGGETLEEYIYVPLSQAQ